MAGIGMGGPQPVRDPRSPTGWSMPGMSPTTSPVTYSTPGLVPQIQTTTQTAPGWTQSQSYGQDPMRMFQAEQEAARGLAEAQRTAEIEAERITNQRQLEAESRAANQRAAEFAQRQSAGQEAEARRMQQLSQLMNMSSSTGAGPLTVPAADEAGARAAAFARAKDQAAQIARASLTGLRESLAERGVLGGGIEREGTAGILGGAGGQLGEFTREQLIQDLNRAAQVADRERAAQIAMRSQDLSRQAALLGLFQSAGGTVY